MTKPKNTVGGLRGLKASVKPDDENGAVCEVTVSAPCLYSPDGTSVAVGESVILERDGQAHTARLESIRLKVSGARSLDAFVNKTLGLKAAQKPLPLTGSREVPENPAETVTLKPKKDGLCKCGHPWSQDKNPKRAKDGHGKMSGKCYVEGCGCEGFIPGEAGG